MQLVPIGVRGDLYVGGDGLARGYLNNPMLTSERFVRNPFRDDTDTQLYNTGDHARFRPDGHIEFLGRTDLQVKIRGYRIELEEIETVLNQHPAVRRSAIVPGERNSLAEDSLVCYVVPRQQRALSVNELREYLKDKLPVYMIPSMFISIENFPLTPNGKLDRSKLPAPKPTFNESVVSARTEIEELVAQVWRDVLKLDTIGIHENFFELGGHSLLAVQIISRLRGIFDKDVPIPAIFDTPTIAGLATTIEKTISGGWNDLPPITHTPRDEPLPLSMNQEHLWYLDKAMPGTCFFNMPYVYQLSGDLNVGALEKALKQILSRHEALRTVFSEVDGHPVQIITDKVEFQLPLIDLRTQSAGDASERAAAQILEERLSPFDLAKGPLIRTTLIRLTDGESLLLLSIHHIISDYESILILRRELVALYASFVDEVPIQLDKLDTQFADFAVWERQMLKHNLFNSHLDFWQKQLVELPLQYQSRDNGTGRTKAFFHSGVGTINFDGNQLSRIKHLAMRESCTPFLLITAALAIFTHQLTGQREVRVGTLSSDRHRKGTEFVVGPMMNTLVLRLQIDPITSLANFLTRTRETVLAAFTHQKLPFEYLARALERNQKATRDGLFQILMIYNRASASINVPSLTLAPFEMNRLFVTNDTTLTACEMIIRLNDSSTKLSGTVTYNEEVFRSDVVLSLGESLMYVIEVMIREPCRLISTIGLGN